MPFVLTFVMPAIALFYKGVTVYHTYPGDMISASPSRSFYTLQPKSHDRMFAVGTFEDDQKALKEMIDDGIETYATFDTESGEYLIYRTYEVLMANDQLLGKFFSSMHRNFYHRKDSNISDMAQEIMDDREMSDMLYQLGGLYGMKDKSIEDVLKLLAENQIVHLLLMMYFDSGSNIIDICAKHALSHWGKYENLIDAWRVLMKVIEQPPESRA